MMAAVRLGQNTVIKNGGKGGNVNSVDNDVSDYGVQHLGLAIDLSMDWVGLNNNKQQFFLCRGRGKRDLSVFNSQL